MLKRTELKEAQDLAKAESSKPENKRKTLYIIKCNRNRAYFIDTNGLVRNWESLVEMYCNGKLLA